MISGIIVAGGSGVRMKAAVRKQYLPLGGRPVLAYSLIHFSRCIEIDDIFLVVPASDVDRCREAVLSPLDLQKPVALVPGGPTRQDSVYNGLRAAAGGRRMVVIHDGVRPFTPPDLISACIAGAEEREACIAGEPVADTLKRADENGDILETIDRRGVWRAQTPQAFAYDLIRDAHEAARRDGFQGTDDAALVERLGKRVRMVPGSRWNIKITTPADLRLAGAVLPLILS